MFELSMVLQLIRKESHQIFRFSLVPKLLVSKPTPFFNVDSKQFGHVPFLREIMFLKLLIYGTKNGIAHEIDEQFHCVSVSALTYLGEQRHGKPCETERVNKQKRRLLHLWTDRRVENIF